MLYAPADSGASLRPGAEVDLTVQSVPAQSYGVLRGTVKSVGRTARTRQQISADLGSTQLGEEFSRNGPPIAVEVRLHPTKSTRSGYTWSTSDGPPHPLTTHPRRRRRPPGRTAPGRLAPPVTAPAAGTGSAAPPTPGGRRGRRAAPPPAAAAPRPRAVRPAGGRSAPPPSSRWRRWSAAPPVSPWSSPTTGGTSRWRSCGSPAASPATAHAPATS
ncbi:hypothetical protein ACFQVA_36710 [Actinomadura keratinilytica]